MLVNWTLGNFKSVGRELNLSLAPITVLVGANSSGKSTIIQSILLIKQTLQYATPDRPIALNGPLLKLGNFNDVINVMSRDTNGFRIGWKYNAGMLSSLLPTSIGPNSFPPLRSATYRTDISDIELTTTFNVSPSAQTSELSLLQPSLGFCDFSATSTQETENHGAHLEVTRASDAEAQPVASRTPLISGGDRRAFSNYRVSDIDMETNAAALEDHPNGKIVGAVLRHFFPFYLAVEFDAAQRRAMHIADAICAQRRSIRFQREYAHLPVPPSLLEIINEWLNANAEVFPEQKELFQTPSTENLQRMSDIVDMLQNLQRRLRHRHPSGLASMPSLQELQPRIASALAASFPSQIDIGFERPRLIFDAQIQTREYFENYVRYLGPLRDEPKPLYPLEALANPTDVGYRGEHTAAVLHLNQFEWIDYVPSSNFPDGPDSSSIVLTRTREVLRRAVVDWLTYMGVVEGIATDDKGKIGHEMQVKTSGIDKFHDLTNVGVGVSQVLPIVLMALLAEPGSLLIFEQPELHLHPRVQTRLADFFISIVLAGKQCLLETHSEYLIHRLRRRIAEAPGDQLAQLSKLYFVERSAGLTSCTQVDITQYGAILDWPADFFDQAQVEAERILAAASAKRAHERRERRTTSDAT